MPKRNFIRHARGHMLIQGPGRVDASKGMFTIDSEGPYSWHGLEQELELDASEQAQILAMNRGDELELHGDDDISITRLMFDRGDQTFKEYPTIGWPKFLGHGWLDNSWGNDAMARAALSLSADPYDTGETPMLALWVNYDGKDSREIGDKYALNYEPTGYSSGEDVTEIYKGDDAIAVAMKIQDFLGAFFQIGDEVVFPAPFSVEGSDFVVPSDTTARLAHIDATGFHLTHFEAGSSATREGPEFTGRSRMPQALIIPRMPAGIPFVLDASEAAAGERGASAAETL
jgi:hypothetical protein